MNKVPSLGVDTVVFDIEDGVAADQKVVHSHFILSTECSIRAFCGTINMQ